MLPNLLNGCISISDPFPHHSGGIQVFQFGQVAKDSQAPACDHPIDLFRSVSGRRPDNDLLRLTARGSRLQAATCAVVASSILLSADTQPPS
jgi:hypothetical protein